MNDKADAVLEDVAARFVEAIADDPPALQLLKVCDLVAANSDLILTRAFGAWTIHIVNTLGIDEMQAIIKRRKHEAPIF